MGRPSASPSTLELFSYNRLENKNSFRLLSLLPEGTFTDKQKLHGTLIERPLVGAPHYAALSYTWGSVSPPCFIYLDERPLQITKNLSDALVKLQKRGLHIMIWVDAICINQGDILERNNQVLHMQRIYQQADEVIIDVGPEADGSGSIPALCDQILEANRKWLESHTQVQTPAEAAINLLEYESLGLPLSGAPAWNIFSKFLGRPWFVRTWTIQEAVLACKATISCGEWTMSAETFTEAFLSAAARRLPIIEQGGVFNAPGGTGARQLIVMCDLGAGTFEHQQRPLMDLLQLARKSSATDPRDKLFAILGLSDDAGNENLQPDYNETMASACYRYAKHLIKKGHGVQLLYNASSSLPLAPSPDIGLPSWVPNWETPPPPRLNRALHYGLADSRAHYFHDSASRSVPASIKIHPSDEEILLISGLIIDTVVEVGIAHSKDNSKTPLAGAFELVKDCIAEMQVMLRKSSAYRDLESRINAIWRTAIWNHLIDEVTPADAESIKFYNAFLLVTSGRGTRQQREEAVELSLKFLTSSEIHCKTMRRALTRRGYLTQVPLSTMPGDIIVLVLGADMPFVWRQVDDGEEKLFCHIGDCYVHDMMNGEALDIGDANIQQMMLT